MHFSQILCGDFDDLAIVGHQPVNLALDVSRLRVDSASFQPEYQTLGDWCADKTEFAPRGCLLLDVKVTCEDT